MMSSTSSLRAPKGRSEVPEGCNPYISGLLRFCFGFASQSLAMMLFIFGFNYSTLAYADTVFLKDDQEAKGIVVEEYIDRIKLSTMDGEIEILKSDIKDILYDLRVQNLIKLGDFHKQKGNLARAYVYYRKAYHTDPSFELAKTRYLQLRSIMLKRPYEQLEKQIEKRKAILRASGGLAKAEEGIPVALEEKLKKFIGIRLISRDERPYVNKVYSGSPAYLAGIKKGDYIIAVWNRLTGYMQLQDVCDMILSAKTGEANLTIERTLKLIKEKDTKYTKGGVASLGVYVDVRKKGLTITRILGNSVAAKCGLLESDVIDKITDQSTRYMPVNEAVNLIESLGSDAEITIHRDVTIWKGRG